MDEDQILQSIIADPKLTDPSIDVSQFRQTTETNPLLLANVPEFSGLKYDFTNRDYFKNLYDLYGGGAPLLPEPVVETPVVTTPIVDTSVMDQPAGDSVLDTTPQDFGQNLVDQGIGVQATPFDPVVAPGEMPLTQDDFDDFNKIAVTPQTFADTDRADLLDQAGNVPGVGFATDFFPDIDTNVGTVLGKSGIERFDDAEAGIDIFEDTATGQAETPVAFDRPTIADVAGPVTLSRQDVIDTDANVGFVDAPTLEAEDVDTSGNLLQSGIDKIKNVIPDFDPLVAGTKLAFNTLIGKPVTLVFDLLKAAGLEGGRGEFSDKLEEEYGMDDIGRLTSGPMKGYTPAAGDIVGAAQERIENIENRSAPQTEASIEKVQELNEFVQKATQAKADIAAPQEDVGAVSRDTTTGADPTTGDLPGGGNIADEFGSDGDTGRTTGPTVSRSDPDFGQFGRQQSATAAGGGSSGGGGKSIVCTAMYQTTGLEDWKKAMKIWYIYQKKYLTIQHQEGYHKLFKPFVKGMHKSKIIKAIGAHIAKHRTQHLKHIMFNSKPSLLGKIYNKILEPICYWVGKYD